MANNGQQALDLIQSEENRKTPFELILMDMQMPVLDGFEATQQLRKDGYSGKIIALTAHASDDMRRRCLDAGCDGFVSKPIDRVELLDLVKVSEITPLTERSHPQAENSHILQSSQSLRILLAEDSPVIQKLVVRMLENKGHSMQVVNNGIEAVTAFEQSSFDLVLMDIQMPTMDGFTATSAIRENEKLSGKHSTPIIALTAHALKGEREKCLEAGMDEYITKPINWKELFRLIGQTTESHRLNQV